MAILPNRGLETPYFSLQGRVMVAQRNLPDDEDSNLLIAPVSPFQFLGNIDKFDYSLSTDREIIKDNYSGLRQPDYTAIFGTEITMDLSLFGYTELAVSIAHRGLWSAIAAGQATNATLIQYSQRFQRFVAVTGTPTLNADYYLGKRAADGSWQPYRHLKVATLLVKDSTATPITLVKDTNYKVYPRTGRIVFIDLTTGGPFAAPIKGNTDFGTVEVELSKNLGYGLEYGLGYMNITSFTLVDSAGTPATVDPAYYTLSSEFGTIKFNKAQLAAIEAEEYVEPLVATFNYGPQRHMSMMTASLDREYWVRFNGYNTADNNNPVVFEFYRVKFQEGEGMSLIHERTGKMPIKATALADLRMPADDILGNVGHILTY